ncbi:MAG TPA: CoA transferase [Acidimicrobiales bacterium]|jgi:crotonobetainyl-CoA:carnitine CoA-transferase CaiB-like acyl-CoA transferase|nr:CoA transferase [Acidimicrobiales bacterium]
MGSWPEDPASQGTGLPLEGVRVLDLSKILAGPLCVLVAADLGADVIKVEAPIHGDRIRTFAPPSFGVDATYYLSVNRNRRSIAVDLATPEGLELVARLAKDADAVVENFLPHQLVALGLVELREQLDVVWVSVRGAASGGPLADVPSFDLLAQARSGLMSVTGMPDGPPLKVGAPLADVVTGLFAAAALLAGLFARARGTNRSHRFEVPLLESTIVALVNQAQGYLVTGDDPGRLGNDHPSIAPYGPVETSEGSLFIAVATRDHFVAMCDALGAPELAEDPRFATNAARITHREEFDAALRARFSTRSASEWEAVLVEAGVPCGPVHSVQSALADPQIRDGGLVTTATTSAGEFRMLRSPIRVDGAWLPVRRSPPVLDQDGEHIRASLGDA